MDKKCPDFKTKYNRCESLLSLEFALLEVVLHQEVLQDLVKYATDLQVQIEDIQPLNAKSLEVVGSGSTLKRTLSTLSDGLMGHSSSSNLKMSKY